jgi:AmmeMemoRadiSam system protein B
VLGSLVDQLVSQARGVAAGGPPLPKAVVVPHAGYVYSGPVAATAYARLAPAAGRITRVVMLGPAHHVWFEGLALDPADRFATPLGDTRTVRPTLPGVVVDARPHADEHALEVQLPFLQRVLGDVEIVPLLVGDASASAVAAVIDALWGGVETLVLVSSDLSHYHAWREACALDARSAEQITALRPSLSHDQACGATPINGLLEVARRRGLRVECLDLRNSGDTAGPRDRVVGYGAFAFYEPERRASESGRI